MRVARLLAASLSAAWLSPRLVCLDDSRFPPEEVCERVLPSVFRIMLLDPDSGSKLGIGSGFCIRPDGTALTAYHVASSQAELFAKFEDGTKSEVEFINGDQDTDVAIVKVNASRPAKLGSSAKLRRGEQVIHFGNVSTSESVEIDVGYINKTKEDFPSWLRHRDPEEELRTRSGVNFIVTQGSARHGFSGGPLVNMRAEVIGLIVRMFIQYDGSVIHHEGCSVPIDTVMQIVDALETEGKVIKPSVGIRFRASSEGLRIIGVGYDSPAEKAGIRAGDVLLEINSSKTKTSGDYFSAIGFKKHVRLVLKVKSRSGVRDVVVST